MIIVLDASAAIEIVLNRDLGEQYKSLLKKADLVLAPDTFPSEITNVFWKYAEYSDMSANICQKGIESCLIMIDDYINTKELCREVFSESIKNSHSAYDLFYLVIARRWNATLLTRDKKMLKIAHEMKISTCSQCE